MATVKNYRELLVWQKSHIFCVEVYRVTKTFPTSEQFGLTNQIRRAAVSIPSNIVEGFERGSNKEFKQFLIIARGSLGESQAQLDIARDLSYISETQHLSLYKMSVEVHKMINSFIKHLR